MSGYKIGMAEEAVITDLTAKIERFEEELDTERMRIAACGVIALANTPDSAKQARQMKREYWSASCTDVANAVDREMALRDKLAESQAREAKLREALEEIKKFTSFVGTFIVAEDALALPHDDTALKEYRKKVLLEVATKLEDNPGRFYFDGVDELRRMAEE